MTSRAKAPMIVIRVASVLLLLAIPYWACAEDGLDAKGRPRAAATAATAPAAAKPVGRLTVAIPADFANLTPYTAGTSAADFLMELVFGKLYAPSPYVARPQ